ncbi:DUF3800 domain-containing protein [Chiayiivirga flava]|uniref:DUF3800 domain-containing protein n=1 Tax=Chiayiivirga flava TaxID=659595 RepID=A0A7W8D6Y6_9GAMM|nr:hypothetical protein [Chiayiivirga flava]
MHFFYIDESGDTGANLADQYQPIFVLGGISVRDEGWNITQERLSQIISDYFGGNTPNDFELHSKELLCPAGDGPFSGHDLQPRCELALRLLGLLEERAHGVHYLAIDKQALAVTNHDAPVPYGSNQPYPIGFDYLITYINWYVRDRLGISARGMVILDQKDQHHGLIEQLMHERRFGGVPAHRVKWVVEFSYSVDSQKNPMIQLSDLVIYCTKRFIEIEKGHRDAWSQDAKNFYAKCYSIIRGRVVRTTLVERNGRYMDRLNAFIAAVRVEPRVQWRRHYDLADD